MSTTARDPVADNAQSSLPPGGSPAGDAAYLDWAREFCNTVNRRWQDRWTGWGKCRPVGVGDLLNQWRLNNHIYKFLIGWDFPSGTGPNIRHRIRFCSVQFQLRQQEIVDEAERYAAQVEDEQLQAIP